MNQAMAQAPGGAPMTKALQAIMKEVDLLPGEQVQYTIQGDGYFLGTNPALKAIAVFQAAMVKLTGGHIRIFIIVTNQRVLLANSFSQCCGVKRMKGVNAIALASVAECGWAKETQMCCVHSRVVHLETKTQRHTLVIKKLKDDGLRQFVANLSAVMVSNVQNRTST
jgi:hypothetical protein